MSLTAQMLLAAIAALYLLMVGGGLWLIRQGTRAQRESLESLGFSASTAQLMAHHEAGWHVFNVVMFCGFAVAPLVFLVLLHDMLGTWR